MYIMYSFVVESDLRQGSARRTPSPCWASLSGQQSFLSLKAEPLLTLCPHVDVSMHTQKFKKNTYMFIQIYAYMYTSIRTFMHISVKTHWFISMHTERERQRERERPRCMCMYVCMYVCTYIYIHICIYRVSRKS